MNKKMTFYILHQTSFWPFLRPYRFKLFVGIFMIIVAQITFAINPSVEGMITTQLSKDVMDIANNIPGAHIQMDIIIQIAILLGIIYIIKTVSQYLMAFYLTDAIQFTMYDIRNAVEDKMQHLPVSYFDKEKTGELLSRITNDVDTLSNSVTTNFITSYFCCLYICVCLVYDVSYPCDHGIDHSMYFTDHLFLITFYRQKITTII